MILSDPTPDMHQAASRLTLLQHVAAALASATSIADVAMIVLHEGLPVLGARAGVVVLVAPDQPLAHIVLSLGYPVSTLDPAGTIPLESLTPLTDAIRTAEPVWIEDETVWWTRYPALFSLFDAWEPQALAVMPLLVDGVARGAIGLSFATPQRFSATDRAFIATLAQHVAFALTHLILRAKLEQRITYQTSLTGLATLALGQGALSALARDAAEQIGQTLDVDRVSIAANELTLTLTRIGTIWQPMVGEPEMVDSSLAASARAGEQAELRVPLGDPVHPLGELAVGSTRPRVFTEEDRSYLIAAGTVIATMVERHVTAAERAQIQREREDYLSRMIAVIDHMPAGVILIDATLDELVLINTAVDRLFGYTTPLPLPITDYSRYVGYFADGRQYRLADWPAARAQKENIAIFGEEIMIRRADGSTMMIEASAVPVHDAHGNVIAAVGVFVDISERKAREAAIRAFDARLQETQRHESLGMLARGIAHDFNNLLSVVLGNANRAQIVAQDSATLTPLLARITIAAQEAAALTHQMLAYAGKSQSAPLALDVGELVHSMYPLLRSLVPSDVQIELDLAPTAMSVVIDPIELRQVVLNLVMNAAEAIGDTAGVVIVRISSSQEPMPQIDAVSRGAVASDGHVVMEVVDTGSGMSDRTQMRVFEPFFTTKPTSRGLGLAVVYGIARQYHGSVEVHSVPGSGTTIRVWLRAVSKVKPGLRLTAQS